VPMMTFPRRMKACSSRKRAIPAPVDKDPEPDQIPEPEADPESTAANSTVDASELYICTSTGRGVVMPRDVDTSSLVDRSSRCRR